MAKDDWEAKLKEIEEREADPAWQAQQERVRAEMERVRAEREREIKRALERAQAEALRALELPAKALEALSSGQPAVRTRAIEEVERPATILVLSGGAGVGKTVAACWWLRSWVLALENWTKAEEFRRPKLIGSAVFVTAPRLARWGRYDERQMDALIEASRMVIDDLGTEFLDAKGNFLTIFDEVVNERYANNRPTVITTNMPLTTPQKDGFRERYGERVADRIRESGRFIGLGDASLRPRAGRAPQQKPLSVVKGPPPAPPPPDPRLPRERDDDEDHERPAS